MGFCDVSAFAVLLGCFRPTPLLLSCAFLPLTDVCSLAHVAGKSQHDGDASEVPSAARAAGSKARASPSAPLAPQPRSSWDSLSVGSVC